MTYHVNVLKCLFSMDDHLFRIQRAERYRNIWKVSILLLLFSMAIYIWMSLLGMGSTIISEGAITRNPAEYEQIKFWFVVGRVVFSILFTAFILFVPSLLYAYLTKISYYKLIIMQQVVLMLMLVERLIWIPLAMFAGLKWYVSPLSLGVMTSTFTDMPWLIYFFGCISVVQLFIIWLQVKYIGVMDHNIPKVKRWLSVAGLHILGWVLVASAKLIEINYAGGWFG